MEFKIKDDILINFIPDGSDTVIIPEGVKAIGPGAFKGTGIKSVEFPSSLELIGEEAFYGCNSLKEVSFPASLKKIGFGAFAWCKKLATVKFSEGITSIGSICFSGTAVKSLSLPVSLVNIGPSAFSPCFNLEKIKISGEIKKIPSGCFEDCEKLVSAEIPDSVEVIRSDAFRNCKALPLFNFPSSLKAVCSGAFYDCAALRKAEFPEGICGIGEDAFNGCTSLAVVTFPATMTEIYSGAFKHCISLRNLRLPDNLMKLEKDAFVNSGIISLYIPKNVRDISFNSPFEGCTDIAEITVSTQNESYYSEGNCLIRKYTNEVVLGCASSVIPEGISIIGKGAFSRTKVAKLIIPESVKEIRSFAFSNCSLTELIIPASVDSAGNMIYDRKGGYLLYEGNKIDAGALARTVTVNCFIAAPAFDLTGDADAKQRLTIGYCIYLKKGGNKSIYHEKYMNYLRRQASEIIKCALVCPDPNGYEFMEYLMDENVIRGNKFRVIDEVIDACSSPEIKSRWIDYKASLSRKNPYSDIEKGLEDL